jgi:predicted hotdog family 3-hydroxylacyl-ACP dehydratase
MARVTGGWQVLSVHASLNAAHTKISRIKQGRMATTLGAYLGTRQVQLSTTNNPTLGPAVIFRWVE